MPYCAATLRVRSRTGSAAATRVTSCFISIRPGKNPLGMVAIVPTPNIPARRGVFVIAVPLGKFRCHASTLKLFLSIESYGGRFLLTDTMLNQVFCGDRAHVTPAAYPARGPMRGPC